MSTAQALLPVYNLHATAERRLIALTSGAVPFHELSAPPRRRLSIAQPRPMACPIVSWDTIKHLEELAEELDEVCVQHEKLAKATGAGRRESELPSLRTLHEVLPRHDTPRARPSRVRPSPIKTPQVFNPPGKDDEEFEEAYIVASPEPIAAPAPKEGWTVRLIQPKQVAPADDHLPLMDRKPQCFSSCWQTQSPSGREKSPAITPQYVLHFIFLVH